MSDTSQIPSVNHGFVQASAPPSEKKALFPTSVRFTREERALLDTWAGKRSLSAYIREKVLGDAVASNIRRPARKARKPQVDDQAAARLLAALGQSRLSSNLNQIAKAANMGALPLTPDLTRELEAACADVKAMRTNLVAALGLQERGSE